VREILEILQPQPGETAVDGTLGYGGHAREILPLLLPHGRLIGLDVDSLELPRTEARLRTLEIPPEALIVRHSNFAGLPRVLASLQIESVDLVLADLGCSSMQFDNPARGFSFKLEGPLDLRMNPNKGQPASALLANWSEAQLATILTENSDEPHAVLLAKAIVQGRGRQPITTTSALTRLIREALKTLPPQIREAEGDLPIRRVFQALRIEANGEFDALETFLRFLPACLKSGARVAILTFHSGEDRRVKHAFQEGVRSGVYASAAREVIRPSPEEIHSNPRASSAKLRWAIRA
jgi:16S rRNA (cytosine1402-N4)-methyltransferase